MTTRLLRALAVATVTLAACGSGSTPPKRASEPGAQLSGSSAPGTAAGSPQNVDPVVDTGPLLRGGHAVIRPEAVGPLRIGMWRRAAMSFVYAITAFAGSDSSEIIPVKRVGADTVTLIISNDTVVRMQVLRPGARTLEGFGVGTPIATLRAEHDATVTSEHGATSVALRRYCGIRFTTSDSTIHSGATPPKGARVVPPLFPADSAVVRTVVVDRCHGTPATNP